MTYCEQSDRSRRGAEMTSDEAKSGDGGNRTHGTFPPNTRSVTALRTRPGGEPELDTLALAVEGDRLTFTLDDGERLDVHVHELLGELDYELVADTLEDLAAGLRIALRALEWYAKESNWSEDDWGVRAVVNPPDYGDAGSKARNAIKRIQKAIGA